MIKRWFWLSFADPTRPAGEQFLGACIVEAPDPISAVQMSWALGCNPGGEVKFAVLPMAPPEDKRGRLLGPDEDPGYWDAFTE